MKKKAKIWSFFLWLFLYALFIMQEMRMLLYLFYFSLSRNVQSVCNIVVCTLILTYRMHYKVCIPKNLHSHTCMCALYIINPDSISKFKKVDRCLEKWNKGSCWHNNGQWKFVFCICFLIVVMFFVVLVDVVWYARDWYWRLATEHCVPTLHQEQ